MGFAAAGLALYGAIQQSRAEKKAGRQNAKIEKANARVAERQAADAERRGAEDIRRLRMQGRKLIGTQRATLAAQGIELGEGTAGTLIQDTEAAIELDSLTIANNAAMEAFGFRTQSSDAMERARIRSREARDRAQGVLLSGATSAAVQGYQAYRAGRG